MPPYVVYKFIILGFLDCKWYHSLIRFDWFCIFV